jgi:hypothetical protein
LRLRGEERKTEKNVESKFWDFLNLAKDLRCGVLRTNSK